MKDQIGTRELIYSAAIAGATIRPFSNELHSIRWENTLGEPFWFMIPPDFVEKIVAQLLVCKATADGHFYTGTQRGDRSYVVIRKRGWMQSKIACDRSASLEVNTIRCCVFAITEAWYGDPGTPGHHG